MCIYQGTWSRFAQIVNAFFRRAGGQFSSLPAARSPRCERRGASFTFREETRTFLSREVCMCRVKLNPLPRRVARTVASRRSRSTAFTHTDTHGGGRKDKKSNIELRSLRSPDRGGTQATTKSSSLAPRTCHRPLINVYHLPSPSRCLFH